MSIPFSKINEILSTWAANDPPIDDITVENVLYAAGLGHNCYDEVLRYLMSKRGFELVPKKMLLCPNNHKVQSFDLEEPIEDEGFDCFCGENDFEAEDLYLVFSFTQQFKEDAIKKKNTKVVSLSRVHQLV